MNTQTAMITRQHWHAEQTKRPTRLWTFSSTRYGSFVVTVICSTCNCGMCYQ